MPTLLMCPHGSDYGSDERDYCSMLEPHGKLLCDMCQDFGSANTVALAELTSDFQRYESTGRATVSAGADVYRGRMERFLKAMERHQNAIDAYHHGTRGGAPKNLPRASLRDTLQRTGAELNQMFRQELAQLTGNWFPRSRMLVSGRVVVPDRVRHNPKISRLDVRTPTQAWMLAKLGTCARYLSRGLVVIDLGRRAQNVDAVRDAGGDWHRQAAIEAAGFGGSAITGGLGAAAAGEVLSAVAMLTPAGWVLIVAGLAVAGAVAAGTILAGQAAEDFARQQYDQVLAFQKALQ
ncbi:hypothetical protein [Thiomonas sp.]|uniref:hypothetical protein n=1 Tax=Thiomonas sp. TaxID=2047785 RepID=UPI002605B41B|nr:hypothetical protein [Thiomonas sp.]